MVTPRWALLDHQHLNEYLFPEGEGFLLIARTDDPVHLWCRVSSNLPDKHYISQVRRGLTTMKATYRCFNVYQDIEQLEPGDTLIHKFHLKSVPYQKTRYFHYWGEKAGVPSPSETCIFIVKRTWRRGLQDQIYNPASARALRVTYYRPQAQTFTPTKTFDLTAVYCRLQCFPTGHKVIAEIRTTEATGEPGAHVLAQITYPNFPPDWCDMATKEIWIPFPRTRVISGSLVAFCLWGDPAFPDEIQCNFLRDDFGDDYPDGDAWNGYFDPPNAYWKSCPYVGGPWFDDYDHRFGIYGLPF